MEIKMNDATINRPQGDRAIDAPAVLVHLQEYAGMIKTEKAWQQNDRNAITVFKSEGITIVLTLLKTGASLNGIETDGYCSLLVTEGKIKSEAGEMKDCAAGDLMVFHPGVVYTITAQTESSILLTHFASQSEAQKSEDSDKESENWARRS